VAFAHITIHLNLPGTRSLKAKRSLLARLETAVRKLNYAFAEVGSQDLWQESMVQLATVSSDGRLMESRLALLEDQICQTAPDVMITRIEIERF
jgi:uncharacterized protein YlxP (DUF503 family)